jgi:hypothetical protein
MEQIQRNILKELYKRRTDRDGVNLRGVWLDVGRVTTDEFRREWDALNERGLVRGDLIPNLLGEIIGVGFITSDGEEESQRPLHVEYSDGFEHLKQTSNDELKASLLQEISTISGKPGRLTVVFSLIIESIERIEDRLSRLERSNPAQPGAPEAEATQA